MKVFWHPLAAGQLRKVGPLLLLGTEGVNVVRAEAVVRGDAQTDATVGGADFLENGHVLHVAQSGATVLLGDQHAEHPQLPELVEHFPGKGLRLVPLPSVRCNLVLCEVPDHVPDRQLILVEIEVHALLPSAAVPRRMRQRL